MPATPLWRVTPEWQGETGFIIGGGPSVARLDIERLRARNVIVINSSYQAAPFAQFLLFCDYKWWDRGGHRPSLKELAANGLRVVSICSSADVRKDGPPFLRLQKVPVDRHSSVRLSDNPSCLAMKRTTFTAAINMAVHLGCKRVVLIGADGKADEKTGRSHHHKPHPWPVQPGCWQKHQKEFLGIVGCLRRREVEVLNANPDSAYTAFRKITFDEALRL